MNNQEIDYLIHLLTNAPLTENSNMDAFHPQIHLNLISSRYCSGRLISIYCYPNFNLKLLLEDEFQRVAQSDGEGQMLMRITVLAI